MKLSRGDVVLVFFPDSNLRTAKRRPALVVQADDLQTGLPQVIVSMITSNLDRAGHPSRLTVERASPRGREMGLRTDSVVMTDNLATVVHSEIDRVLGHLADMQPVDVALCRTLGLSPSSPCSATDHGPLT
jgi:mRNA interferase MazF